VIAVKGCESDCKRHGWRDPVWTRSFAYEMNYLIDNKFGIILDAEGTRANRTAEIAVAQAMLERVERRFDLRPARLTGDSAFGAARLLKWLVDRAITPHVPVWDRSSRVDGKFSRENFVFDRERNVYVCPAGKFLTHSGLLDQGRLLPYRASRSDCSRCDLKARCTTGTSRKVTGDIDEDVREHVRALANTEAFQQSRRERKKVETRSRSPGRADQHAEGIAGGSRRDRMLGGL
jgi:Transposase DDE domain